ncbi:MAG: 6,7-dimethyl-8-ribityllumazine synthase, partial [Pseudomonadales bacterium]
MKKTDAKFTLVAARFNSDIVDKLIEGAMATLKQEGVPEGNIILVRVPGAFEIPLVAKKIADQGKTDAIIALGAVIRGDTPHFDFVAGECASGLTRASPDTGVPMAFGVLTTDTVKQAVERSGSNVRKKAGSEA